MSIKINGKNLVNMAGAYNNCTNLTGKPECGPVVQNMSNAYSNCFNLTGNPIVGPNVTDMSYAYNNCKNLTGTPMSSPNVTNMAYTYANCVNLYGYPTCGNNTVNMAYTYYNCYKLSGTPACGHNVNNLSYTYWNCSNIYGIMPLFRNDVTNVTNCFYNKNDANKISLVVYNNSTTFSTIVNNNGSNSILGKSISWQDGWSFSEDSKCHFNKAYKLNVYSGSNVQQMTDDLKSVVVRYSTISPSTPPGFNPGFEFTITNTFNTQTRLFDYVVRTNTPGVMPTLIDLNDVNDEEGRAVDEIEPLSINGEGEGEGEKVEPMAMVLHYCTVAKIDYVNFDAVDSLAYFCSDVTLAEDSDLNTEFWDFTNVTNMYRAFTYAQITKPICMDTVKNMSYAFYYCEKMVGQPLCGNNVTDFSYTYYMCYLLTGSPVCGPNVIDMSGAYCRCFNLTGSPVVGPNVTNMVNAYYLCNSLTGSPVCTNKVTNMAYAYNGCVNLTGNIVVGPNVTDISYAYGNCQKLKGQPQCGPNISGSLAYTYFNCRNLTGSPVCTEKIYNLAYAYENCYQLTGKPVCGNNVTNMYGTYAYCSNLTGPPIIGPNVTYANNAYRNCWNLGGNAYVMSSIVTGMANCFHNGIGNKRINVYVPENSTTLSRCLYTNTYSIIGKNVTFTNNGSCHYNTALNLYIYPVRNVRAVFDGNERPELIMTYEATDTSVRPTNIVGLSNGYTATVSGNTVTLTKNNVSSNVTYISFNDRYQITSIGSMCPTITNLSNSFHNCTNLKGDPVCGDNVTNMADTYRNCRNLTGDAICGPNVTNMLRAYYSCYNLAGTPASGPNVTNMSDAYYDCNRITGNPACGPKVTDLSYAYYRCSNLTGGPAYSNSLTNMAYAYYNCRNLTGSAICGNVVTNIAGCYALCLNIGANAYFFSNRVYNATNCFGGKNNSRRLNIYVPSTGYNTSYNTLQKCLYTNAQSLVGTTISWTKSGSNYYNTAYNIYIYPVANVSSIADGSCTVSNVSNAQYGFTYDSSTGYYVSGNKGKGSSYAICRIDINNPAGKNVYLDCIHSGEGSFDYGMGSKVNVELSLSSSADSSDKLHFNLKGSHDETAIQTIDYGVITQGFIQLKYIKDSSVNNGNDTLQFKIRFA